MIFITQKHSKSVERDFYYAEMACFKRLKFWKSEQLQIGSSKKYFKVPATMHKVEIKDSFTGKQQRHVKRRHLAEGSLPETFVSKISR